MEGCHPCKITSKKEKNLIAADGVVLKIVFRQFTPKNNLALTAHYKVTEGLEVPASFAESPKPSDSICTFYNRVPCTIPDLCRILNSHPSEGCQPCKIMSKKEKNQIAADGVVHPPKKNADSKCEPAFFINSLINVLIKYKHYFNTFLGFNSVSGL